MPLNEEFSNQVVLPQQLDPLETQDFVRLENKLKSLKLISTAIFLMVALATFFVTALVLTNNTPLAILIAIPSALTVLCIWRGIVVMLGFPKKGYLLREHDISYRRGLLFYKLTTIPFNRIQHVEVSQGMIEKAVGLASVKLFTAGGSVSDLSIPGLLPDKAHQIESFLLSKISKYE